MKTLYEYANGNYMVTIYEDGTKIRAHSGSPCPEFPESLDLKITNKCDAGCAWCHEESHGLGRHAKPDGIFEALHGLPAGVEIAIGGGDPLLHPDIEFILEHMREQGLVPNITVNSRHLERHWPLLCRLQDSGLFFGLGVSFHPGMMPWIDKMQERNPNTVIHMIAGLDKTYELWRLVDRPRKILILGYKQYGRGSQYFCKNVEEGMTMWAYWISHFLRYGKATISFDNLAIEQLCIKDLLSDETWNLCYMGDDGKFTMYVDAVTNSYAISSRHDRVPLNGLDSRTAFGLL